MPQSADVLDHVLLLCLPLALGLTVTVAGCDLFGSDSDDKPGWVGNWEAVDAEPESVEYPPDGARIFFSIRTDTITTYSESTFQGNTDCDIDSTEIDNTDGNVITTIEDEDEADPDTAKVRLETANDTLTLTPVETEDEPEITQITAKSIDADPESIIDCPDFGSSAELNRRAPWRD